MIEYGGCMQTSHKSRRRLLLNLGYSLVAVPTLAYPALLEWSKTMERNLPCLHSCMYASLTYPPHGQITLTNPNIHVAHQSFFTVSKEVDLYPVRPPLNLRRRNRASRKPRAGRGEKRSRRRPHVPMWPHKCQGMSSVADRLMRA